MTPAGIPIPAGSPLQGPFWTLLVPAALFAVAAAATWLLYRHFARRPPNGGAGTAAGLLLLAGLVLATPLSLAEDAAAWVDPFVGTGGHGHTYPGASLPFGMVQLSPDTRLEGWDGCSGYHDSDRVVYGFSHTHLSGTGISDYGDILLMPGVGEPRLDSGYGTGHEAGYASPFSKSSERAEPGYYAVRLDDGGIEVELTATERAGLHRYRFPAGAVPHVVLDLQHRDRVLEAGLEIVSPEEIAGWRRSTGWAKDQRVFFVARFSRPMEKIRLLQDGQERVLAGEALSGAAAAVAGTDIRAALLLSPAWVADGSEPLLVKVGISAVDVDGARRNLDAELPGWDFDAVRRAAGDAWSRSLGRIRVEGGTAGQRTSFHTGLYHSLLAPNVFSDIDGRYRGLDGGIHQAEGRRHYTVFSLWDTFRATHPLFTIIERQRTWEFIEAFLAMTRQGGRLPVWELAGNETDTMIGYHAVSVIADAWVKGIRDSDGETALAAMVDSATRDHFGLDAYRRQGFIGGDDASESVSRTLEYAYDDWCIARLAEALGRSDIAAEFDRRSQGWRHLLDPETGFMRPRSNQRWLTPFDPYRVDNHYTEANAWQYSLFVPHDVEGLMAALGGDEVFLHRLEALFTAHPETSGREQADITGLIGQYAHGNEPSHHVAWLAHFAGRPDLSALRVRQILDTLYAAAPDGLSGNEDCGQMSSWYVLSALGLYDVTPGSGQWLLAPPLFARATIRLESGRRFVIRADGAGDSGRFIREARLNGKPLTRSYLRHDEIMAGGELELILGDTAGKAWGRAPADRPRSRVEGPAVLAAPSVRTDADTFRDTLQVALASAEPGADILYRIEPLPGADHSDRLEEMAAPGLVYAGPLLLTDSSRVVFQARSGERLSPLVTAVFHRIPREWTVKVGPKPGAQYTAGGPEALIDGVRGRSDWRLGRWQGYQGVDFEAVVDLGSRRRLTRAGAGFVQDIKAWIWMPREVVIEVSTDGASWRELARLHPGVAEDSEEVVSRDVTADAGGVAARYVRVRAAGYGTIPAWHLGAGGQAWIFVDEILIETASDAGAAGA